MNNHKKQRRPIALSLQGGGSWGAFSWGALDRLLQDPSIDITQITGTSAGALNGLILAHAINSADSYEQGAENARRMLAEFWMRLSQRNDSWMRLLERSSLTGLTNRKPNLPILSGIEMGKNLAALNPLYQYSGLSAYFNELVEHSASNQLRSLIREFIPNCDVVREGERLKLHINAAKLCDDGSFENRIFAGEDITIDSVMASATLRGLFKPVEINGDQYYDGAYAENASFARFVHMEPKDRDFNDILHIMTNPPRTRITPRLQADLSYADLENTSGLVLDQSYDEIMYHMKSNASKDAPHHHLIWFNAPRHYDQTSKQNTKTEFLLHLYKEGYKAADNFIARRGQDIGQRSTINFGALQRAAKSRRSKLNYPFA